MMGAMTDNLADWLLERIADDADRDRRVDHLARAMYGAFQDHNPYPFDEQREDVRTEYLDAAKVIVDREMPSVLVECEAKRRIINELARPEPHPVEGVGWDGGWYAAAEAVLRLLALPYADSPGYRAEWAPERQSS